MSERLGNPEVTKDSAAGVAERIRDGFAGTSIDQQIELGVYHDRVSRRGIDRLHAIGEIGGRRAYQTLSCTQDGTWSFTTVFIDGDGQRTRHRFQPGGAQDADPEVIAALQSSMFAERLQIFE